MLNHIITFLHWIFLSCYVFLWITLALSQGFRTILRAFKKAHCIDLSVWFPWKGEDIAKASQEDIKGISQNHSQVAGRKKRTQQTKTRKPLLAIKPMCLPKLIKLVGMASAIWGSPTTPWFLSQGCGSLTSTKEALTPFEETYLAGACEQVSRYLLQQIEFMSFCKVMCHLLEEWFKQFLVRITFLLLEGLKTEELKFSFLFSLSSWYSDMHFLYLSFTGIHTVCLLPRYSLQEKNCFCLVTSCLSRVYLSAETTHINPHGKWRKKRTKGEEEGQKKSLTG